MIAEFYGTGDKTIVKKIQKDTKDTKSKKSKRSVVRAEPC